jgi:hypothetical protein
VRGLIADSAGGAWTFGGSILTFAFPMILFIVVAVGLYVVYTKPEVVPGHRAPASERPVSYTAIPGPAAQTEGGASAGTNPGPSARADGGAAAGTNPGPAAGTSAGETATTGDAE